VCTLGGYRWEDRPVRPAARVQLRVLMVTGEYPPARGGVGDYTKLLAEQLRRAGADVGVVTRTAYRKTQRAAEDSLPVHAAIPAWGFRSWPRLDGVIQRTRPDVVHIQYQAAAFSMEPAVNLLPVFLRWRAPQTLVVTTFHDLREPYLFPKAGPLRRAVVRTLDRLSHATVVTNQADLDALGGPGWDHRGLVHRWLIPIGSNIDCAPPTDFNRDRWRREIGADEHTMVVSYFGLMNDSKGIEFLVQAMGLLARRGIQARLLIVGGDTGESDPTNRIYSRRIVQLIQSRGLGRQVYWTGFLPNEQVSAALMSSDLCALPFRDGASLRRGSLLAAMVHGLPVITTCPGRPEPMLVDGENVALVQRDSPAALADAMERLWRDPAQRQRLGKGASTLALRFRWDEIASRHMEMYDTLLRCLP